MTLFLLLQIIAPTLLALVQARAKEPSPHHSIWTDHPGVDWFTEFYPVGNGEMGMMISGDPARDEVALNLDTLWQGGPFTSFNNYTGGNPVNSTFPLLGPIRDEIFAAGNASVEPLQNNNLQGYGSLSAAGSFFIDRDYSGTQKGYRRWIDFKKGRVEVEWEEEGGWVERSYFCAYPTRSCHIQTIYPSNSSASTHHSFLSLRSNETTSLACLSSTSLLLSSAAEPLFPLDSMPYSIIASVSLPNGGSSSCENGSITISSDATETRWTLAGATGYDIDLGTREKGYTFGKGTTREKVETEAKGKVALVDELGWEELVKQGSADWEELYGGFELVLGEAVEDGLGEKTTNQTLEAFTWEAGDLVLENVVFNYGRYLLISSARGTLPANLQGVWSRATWINETQSWDTTGPWGCDYHANINVQENYWGAEPTNLGRLTSTLWDLIEKTWIPRGSETAELLYGSRGWVIHDETNSFGYTGTKGLYDGAPEWWDFQAAAAWVLAHAYDRYAYEPSGSFWKRRGYRLVKSHALFWLDNLLPDTFFDDGSLVVAPCNSPEQPLLINGTFSCAIFQQTVSELFEFVLSGAEEAGETDMDFLGEVRDKFERMDRGAHIGRWGQLQEYKLDIDVTNDTHRHISHLYGMFPGSSLSNWNQISPSKSEIYAAVAVSLDHRGNGTADSNTGWAKMHRSAVASSLGNASYAHDLYKYAIKTNLWSNLFSHLGTVFQIDANLAAPGVVMNTLLHSPPTSLSPSSPLTIHLLPSLPDAWSSGSVKNARARGGVGVDLVWKDGEVVSGKVRLDRAGEGCEGTWVILLVGAGEGEVRKEGWLGAKGEWDL